MKNFLITIIFFIFLIFLWQVFFIFSFINPVLFPSPWDLLKIFYQNLFSGQIINDFFISMIRILVSLIIGSLLGIVMGLLSGLINLFQETFGKLFDFLRSIPPVAMLPIFIIWFGIGELSKIVVITWGVFFPIWINTFEGIKNIDLNYCKVAQIFKLNIFQKIKLLFLPGALPFIITGIRNAIAMAYILMFVAEFIGASSGLGYRIAESHLVFRVDKMMLGLLILGFLGFITDFIFKKSISKFFPWLSK